MAEITGATTRNRDSNRRTQPQPAREAKRKREDRNVTPAPKGWGGVASLTGANNAQGINQQDYKPKGWGSAAGSPFNYGTRPYLQNNPTMPNIPTWSYDRAIMNAFGVGGTQAPYTSPDAQRRFALEDFISPGYQAPAISKNIAERYSDWINSARNSELGYNSYLLPEPGFRAQTNTGGSGGGGGGGGWGGGGGYGGGGGGGASNYSSWLRDMLTRWNI